MKSVRCRRSGMFAGVTLLEMSVLILALLVLISILVIGARAWLRGSDRSSCIMNLRKAQMGVRAYQNIHNLPDNATINVNSTVFGASGFVNNPVCPAGGSYTDIGRIPVPGELVMKCSLAGTLEHEPDSATDW